MNVLDGIRGAAFALNFGLSFYYFCKDQYDKATFFMVCALGLTK